MTPYRTAAPRPIPTRKRVIVRRPRPIETPEQAARRAKAASAAKIRELVAVVQQAEERKRATSPVYFTVEMLFALLQLLFTL